MPQVTVNATGRWKCRNAQGRFYFSTSSFSFDVDSAPDASVYYQDALQYALNNDVIPGNCDSYRITVDSVTLQGGGDVSGNEVTVYFYVWCVDTQNNKLGHEYTQRVNVPITMDISDVEAKVKDMAAQFYDTAIDTYCQDAFSYDYRIISPAYYAYSTGG